MTQKKKVAIVGAGASGLPCIRHALLYDLDVTCFEVSSHIGGLWRYREEETECPTEGPDIGGSKMPPRPQQYMYLALDNTRKQESEEKKLDKLYLGAM
ncbi:hypothetical protein COOONC_06398 [Cooperia oncophora]